MRLFYANNAYKFLPQNSNDWPKINLIWKNSIVWWKQMRSLRQTDGFGNFSVFTWTENHPLIWDSFMNSKVFVIWICLLLVDRKWIRCVSIIYRSDSILCSLYRACIINCLQYFDEKDIQKQTFHLSDGFIFHNLPLPLISLHFVLFFLWIVIPQDAFFNSFTFIFDLKISYDISLTEVKEAKYKYLRTDFQNQTNHSRVW